MKKLTLLLTTLFLLAGAASAAVLDFEGVSVEQNANLDLNQNFQVAHYCWVEGVHVGGEHIYEWDGTEHTRPAQCVEESWIEDCLRSNRVIDISQEGKCGVECELGTEPGQGKDADICVPKSPERCHQEGLYFEPETGFCFPYEYIQEESHDCSALGKTFNASTNECE